MADHVDPVDSVVQTPSWSGRVADPAWSEATAAAAGLPPRVVAAYANATVIQQVMEPECHLGWTTLAAIGFVESRHGTHGGATVRDDGYVGPGILGPVLDGKVYEAIPDSDGGIYDGDTAWDRAIGPMQFLPSTWAMWGQDGDVNGVIDPNDLDDAAFATALYLCNAGDLSDPDTWRAAIASYNSAPSYLIAVAHKANEYAAAVAP
jgi:membrane-bound lytic murein transglycosylase B